MKHIKPISLSIFWVVLGAVLVVCHLTKLIEDYWFSMGIAFIIVGILQIIRHIRYKTDSEYRENRDVATHDERNKFIANKAWAWAGYLFVMVAAVGSIVFKLMGREDLMMLASGSVCLIILLYWGSWMVLRKKY
jgi:drug/metabolite transporter (DMT)-like permease